MNNMRNDTDSPPSHSQKEAVAPASHSPATRESNAPEPPISLEQLPPREALAQLAQDPVGFVQRIVEGAARTHLSDLKEEAELRGALNVLRKAHPEFQRFEPFILQEAARLIQEDADGVIDPWDKLLGKALDVFKQKFQETLQGGMATATEAGNEKNEPPFVESADNRNLPEMPPSFTRDQIGKMSQAEFLKHETAINQALKDKRIR